MQNKSINENTKFGIAIDKWRILMLAVFAILAFTGFLCSIMNGAVAIPFDELWQNVSTGTV